MAGGMACGTAGDHAAAWQAAWPMARLKAEVTYLDGTTRGDIGLHEFLPTYWRLHPSLTILAS